MDRQMQARGDICAYSKVGPGYYPGVNLDFLFALGSCLAQNLLVWLRHLLDQMLDLALGMGSRRHRHPHRCCHRLAAASDPEAASIGSVSGLGSAQSLSSVAACKAFRASVSDPWPECSAIRPHTPPTIHQDVRQRHARLDWAVAT